MWRDGAARAAGEAEIARSSIILCVEDDAVLRASMMRSLARRGYRVRGAASAAEALGRVRRALPALLVVDHDLGPDALTGADLVGEIGRQLSGDAPPAILVSGTVDTIPAADQALFDAVLRKPCRVDELVDHIERLCPDAAVVRSGMQLRRQR